MEALKLQEHDIFSEFRRNKHCKTPTQFWILGSISAKKEVNKSTDFYNFNEFRKDLEFIKIFKNAAEVAFFLGYIRQYGYTDIRPYTAIIEANKNSFPTILLETTNQKALDMHKAMDVGIKIEEFDRYGIRLINEYNQVKITVLEMKPVCSLIPLCFTSKSTIFDSKVLNKIAELAQDVFYGFDHERFDFNEDFGYLYELPNPNSDLPVGTTVLGASLSNFFANSCY